MEVDEDIGNFNLCLTTDEVLCLSVTSQNDDDAGVFHKAIDKWVLGGAEAPPNISELS